MSTKASHTMSFHVTKLAPTLVRPSELTPSGALPLSSLDQLPLLRKHSELLAVFRVSHGHEAAKVIRVALSKALVHYYPIAGRVVTADNGMIHVECTGDGVWYVEALASCSLEDIQFLESQPIMISKDQLLPYPPQTDQTTGVFMMQVTQFKCGGFAVGTITYHSMFDGVGLAQLMKAIGELASGGQLHPKPIWHRELIPDPNPSTRFIPISRPTSVPLQQYSIDISPDQTDRIKDLFLNAAGRTCSTFDILAAKVWQSRTRAVCLEKDADTILSFPMDCHRLLAQALPQLEEGYYGNCLYNVSAKAPSEQIAGISLVQVIQFVQDAKKSLPARFSKWLKGDPEEDPQQISFGYESTILTDWRNVGFFDIDYGWGPPASLVPLTGRGVCVVLNSPAPRKGVRLLTQFVMKEHLEAFQNEFRIWHSGSR